MVTAAALWSMISSDFIRLGATCFEISNEAITKFIFMTSGLPYLYLGENILNGF